MSKPTATACLNCTERNPYCHTTCEKYKAYQQELKDWTTRVIEGRKEYNEGFMKHDAKTRLMLERGRYRKVSK